MQLTSPPSAQGSLAELSFIGDEPQADLPPSVTPTPPVPASLRYADEEQAEDRKVLRDAINGYAQLEALATIISKLESGFESVAVHDPATGDTLQNVEVPLDKTRVSALGRAADLRCKLLDKVLPDVKSVEVSGTGEDGSVSFVFRLPGVASGA